MLFVVKGFSPEILKKAAYNHIVFSWSKWLSPRNLAYSVL